MPSDVNRNLTDAPYEIFHPHVILPAQYFIPPQKFSPEQELMMAILEDAVRCIDRYRFPKDAPGRRMFLEARHWLLASEPQWPYSFECICAALDLDAGAVLQRVGLAPARPAVAPAAATGDGARPIGPARRAGPTLTTRASRRTLGTPEMASGRP
jgi:hypothetical protein